MGRYGACDCLCGECVPGYCRPYLDIYDGPWYTYPMFKSGPEEFYSIAELVDDVLQDRNATYAQILYIHNAGFGNHATQKRMVLKLYNSLTYAPSSTINLERVTVYCADREQPSAVNALPFALYVYLYEGIYVRGSNKALAANFQTPPEWRNFQFTRTGGFRITDFSKLYVHIRSSFNMQTNVVPETIISTDASNLRVRFPESTVAYTGSWSCKPRSKTIAQCLDVDAASFVYLPALLASVGDRLEVKFPAIVPETSRGANHKRVIWEREGLPTFPGEMSMLMALYQSNREITSRTVRLYASTPVVTSDLLNESEHKSITNWGDLRFRMEVLNNTAALGNATVRRLELVSLNTPRVAVTQIYLSRICL